MTHPQDDTPATAIAPDVDALDWSKGEAPMTYYKLYSW